MGIVNGPPLEGSGSGSGSGSGESPSQQLALMRKRLMDQETAAEEWKSVADNLQRQLREAKAGLLQQEREAQNLSYQMKDTLEARDKSFKECAALQQELEKSSHWEADWKTANEYNRLLRKQVAELQAQLEAEQRVSEAWRTELDAAKNEASKTGWVVVGSHLPNREQLDAEIVRLKNLVELEANQRRELQLQVAPLKVSLEDARRVAKSCEGELAIARHEWQHAQQQVAELQAQLETVRAERDAERSEGNRLFGLCADLRKQVAELRAQLDAAAVTPAQQPQPVTILSSMDKRDQAEQIRTQLSEIRNYKDRIKELNTSLADAVSAKNAVQAKNVELSRELNKLKQQPHQKSPAPTAPTAKAIDQATPETATNLRLVITTLAGSDESGAYSLAKAGLKMTATLLRKNRDYGGSAYTKPVLAPGLSPLEAMLCRLSDKVARLSRLLSGEKAAVESESITDTLMDQAGYCILIWTWVTDYIAGAADLSKMLDRGQTDSATDESDEDEDSPSDFNNDSDGWDYSDSRCMGAPT